MTGVTTRYLTVLPRLRQEIQKRAELSLPHVTELLPVELLDLAVEERQEIQALPGNPAHHHPAVFPPSPHPDHEADLLQAIEESGDVRDLEDQSIANLVPPQAFGLGPAEDPEHVVLGGREAVAPEHLGSRVLDQRRGPRDAHGGLLFQRFERLPLLELCLNAL